MAKKEKKPRIGAALLIVLLLAAAGWQLHSLQDQVAAAQAEKARYQTEVETLLARWIIAEDPAPDTHITVDYDGTKLTAK